LSLSGSTSLSGETFPLERADLASTPGSPVRSTHNQPLPCDGSASATFETGGATLARPWAIERFTALYNTHDRRVYAYAVSRAGRQLADEIVSEVFLIAWRRFANLPQPALPWLPGEQRREVTSRYDAGVAV